MALRNLQAAKVAMSKESRRLTAGRKTNTDRLHNESKVRPPTCLPACHPRSYPSVDRDCTLTRAHVGTAGASPEAGSGTEKLGTQAG
jgi:hypothetical protein